MGEKGSSLELAVFPYSCDDGRAKVTVQDLAPHSIQTKRKDQGGRYLDPLTTLGYLAGITTRIRLGISVLVMPYCEQSEASSCRPARRRNPAVQEKTYKTAVFARLLLLVGRSENCYRAVMNDTLLMTEEPEDPEFNRSLAKYRHNGEWLTEHGASLFEQFAGRYVAVSENDIFVADDAWEARRLAKEKHPDDEPFVQYIPKERYERIYYSF